MLVIHFLDFLISLQLFYSKYIVLQSFSFLNLQYASAFVNYYSWTARTRSFLQFFFLIAASSQIFTPPHTQKCTKICTHPTTHHPKNEKKKKTIEAKIFYGVKKIYYFKVNKGSKNLRVRDT